MLILTLYLLKTFQQFSFGLLDSLVSTSVQQMISDIIAPFNFSVLAAKYQKGYTTTWMAYSRQMKLQLKNLVFILALET